MSTVRRTQIARGKLRFSFWWALLAECLVEKNAFAATGVGQMEDGAFFLRIPSTSTMNTVQNKYSGAVVAHCRWGMRAPGMALPNISRFLRIESSVHSLSPANSEGMPFAFDFIELLRGFCQPRRACNFAVFQNNSPEVDQAPLFLFLLANMLSMWIGGHQRWCTWNGLCVNYGPMTRSNCDLSSV